MAAQKKAKKGDSKRNLRGQPVEAAPVRLKEGDAVILPDRKGRMTRWTVVAVGSEREQ